MKLVTFETNDGVKAVGVLKKDSVLSLNKLLKQPDLSMMVLVEKGISYINEIRNEVDSSEGDYSLKEVKILPPLERPKKIVCVGNNYMDHCREQKIKPPERPLIFSKWPSCVVSYNDHIELPKESKQVDYEAELGVIIQTGGKHINREEVSDYIFGYVAVNDISARDVQFSDGQWIRGKSFDTFMPTGPFILTADEVEEPQKLSIKTSLNGKILQNSNTAEMIFDISYIVSYLSEGFTFESGDLIATGTPNGVGVFRHPQIFLQAGDMIEVSIEGLGSLKNTCVER
ncbi:fumarylacetoacetate hydrolase family protein [Aquibacillus saliphilus]|uniref:fumarylacetoacetate hydrolase family protein n=1 Tax=Aquibacillus saliphilus TaxID=1909422 RepID=UPI001CF085B8|nr:fumarylacetoacetate hydrolase family protein [Aquibacillus saliphilus]